MRAYRTVISSKGQVVIPAELREHFGLEKGTRAPARRAHASRRRDLPRPGWVEAPSGVRLRLFGSFGRPRLSRCGAVIMVKSSEDGDRRDGAGEPCSGTFGRNRNPLVDPLVGSRRVEVAHCVLSEDVAEMPLGEDDDVIEALAPDAPQESLAHRVHQRRPHGRAHDTGTHARGDAVQDRAELVVAM